MHRVRVPLVFIPLPLLAAGCFWSSTSVIPSTGVDGTADAAANLRAAVPSLEAYYADHATYAGATLTELRRYDSAVTGVKTVSASETSYCIQSTFRGTTVFRNGPSAPILPGACP